MDGIQDRGRWGDALGKFLSNLYQAPDHEKLHLKDTLWTILSKAHNSDKVSCDPHLLRDIIRNLPPNRSPGPDGIPSQCVNASKTSDGGARSKLRSFFLISRTTWNSAQNNGPRIGIMLWCIYCPKRWEPPALGNTAPSAWWVMYKSCILDGWLERFPPPAKQPWSRSSMDSAVSDKPPKSCTLYPPPRENITKIIRPEYFCVISGGSYGKIA